MIKNKHQLFLLSILLCQLPAYAAEEESAPVSLTVNQQPVDDTLFRTFYRLQAQQNKALLDQDSKKVRVALMNQLVNIMLLSEAAEVRQLDKTPINIAKLRIGRYQTLAQAEISRVLAEKPITDQQVQQAYDEKYANALGKEYHIRHILTASKEDMAKAQQALKDKTPFAEVARNFSTDSSRSIGGDLGWLSPKDLGETLENVANVLKVEEYSLKAVSSEFGWHLLYLEDSRDLPKPPLTEVYTTIKRELQQQLMADYMTGLRNAADIQYTGKKVSGKPME